MTGEICIDFEIISSGKINICEIETKLQIFLMILYGCIRQSTFLWMFPRSRLMQDPDSNKGIGNRIPLGEEKFT